MKKIYLVSYEYFPLSNGGLARHAQEYIDRLIQENEIIAIIAVPVGVYVTCNNISAAKKVYVEILTTVISDILPVRSLY